MTYKNGLGNSTLKNVDGLVYGWDFQPSVVPRWRKRQFVETLIRKSSLRPAWTVLKAIRPHQQWAVFFVYSPTGALNLSHRYTLARLREDDWNILVICASDHPKSLDPDLIHLSDALIWKALSGYDFSAYTIALTQISKCSAGADVFVMNDSVFGPFYDIRPDVLREKWDLTGFTASSQIATHIQSYAFFLKDVTPSRMRKLASVFFPVIALSNASDVVNMQELRFARIASKSMSVGAFWFGEVSTVKDPTLFRAFELVDAGFPFLKKSLLTKHKDKISGPEEVYAKLKEMNHPIEI